MSFDILPRNLAQVDSSGAIIVGGYSDSTDLDSQPNAGGFDVMVMKFSSAGAHQWTVLRGGSGNDYAYGLEAERARLFVVHVAHLQSAECRVYSVECGL